MASDLYTPLELGGRVANLTNNTTGVYTKHGVTIREIASREGTDTAGGSTASVTWQVSGSNNFATGRTALFDLGLEPTVTGGPIDNIFDGLGLVSLSRERIADKIWNFTAEYKQREPEPGQYTISIDTTGGTVMQTYSYTEQRYAASGVTAPAMNGAIDVQDGKPQGVQRVIPALKITIRAKIKSAKITTVGGAMAYAKRIADLTGTVNSGAMFNVFSAGELLFLGASGDVIADNPSLSFTFAASKNVSNMSIGNISGITKYGHDYIWFSFKKEKDSGTSLPVMAPRGAYVNRIYESADHGNLYIGV